MDASGAFGAADLHPTRTDRLVETRDGLRIEYSPGQESYVAAAFERLAAWHTELATAEQQFAALTVSPLPAAAADFRTHRTEILGQIAAEIGLPGPTRLQGRAYDTMLDYYELMAELIDNLSAMSLAFLDIREVQIWRKDELVRRLTAGEKIDGFSYDPVAKEVHFLFRMQVEAPFTDQQRALQDAIEQRKLDHSFYYKIGPDGVADLNALILFAPGQEVSKLEPPERGNIRIEQTDEFRNRLAATSGLPLPIVLSDKNTNKSPAILVDESLDELRALMPPIVARSQYRDPILAFLSLHEATEAGIVENYIGSSDRRWFCDGTANYIAWKVIRDRAGAEVARQAYDLNAQLREFASLQPQINLRGWSAVEHMKEQERETSLTKAHYAFATLALFELVRHSGEATVPRLFREIARTPRRQVTMATVEEAYRKITGRKLNDLLESTEKATLPAKAITP